MARFSRLSVYQTMADVPVVPVFYAPTLEESREVVKACYRGGVRVFEYTNRGSFAHEVFGELYKWAQKECPDMILGAGSIVEEATAALFLQLGANFIVSPMLNPEIFRICNRRQVAYIPGCASISEMSLAQELGAEVVKAFPGEILSPNFIKSILAPMPWTKIMVTGGVEPSTENLSQWFNAGASCVGMGSKLFPRNLIDEGRWDDIVLKVEEVVEIIKNQVKTS